MWRHLPLSDVHPHAQLAAEASEAAAAQGAFWAMHELLLAHQDAPPRAIWSATRAARPRCRPLQRRARARRARRGRFGRRGRRPQQRRRDATFFVNGRRHYGAYDIRSLTEAVRAARARAALAA